MMYFIMMKIPPIDLLAAPQTLDHSQHEPNALCSFKIVVFQMMHSPQPGTSKQQCYDNVDHYL